MANVKRGTQWFDTNVNLQATDGVQSTPLTLLPADVNARDVPGLTIIRTLVDLSIHPVVPVSVFGGQRVLLGAGIVTADAFLANALPDLNAPSDEPIRGWMFKNARHSFQSENSFQFATMHADIHSQRKLDLDTEVFFTIFNQAVTGTSFTVEVNGLIRLLVKLP